MYQVQFMAQYKYFPELLRDWSKSCKEKRKNFRKAKKEYNIYVAVTYLKEYLLK